MHMPNEILSLPVAGGSFAIAAVGLGTLCRVASRTISSEKASLMGIFGAFIFAAQMLNLPLPFPPGASGHLTGAVLLAIVLGPAAASVVMTSVIIIQCLVFQDGGLLALGCNIINLAIVPSFAGHTIYHLIAGARKTKFRIYAASIIACIAATILSAALVSIETAISGVIAVPFVTFLAFMSGVHFVIGIFEGVITASVLAYIYRARGDLINGVAGGSPRLSKAAFIVTLAGATIIIAVSISLVASAKPDGLEWSLQQSTAVSSESIETSTPGPANGWTSLAAVAGSALTMIVIWLVSKIFANRGGGKCITP
ncbi:MAG: cobalamin biosynthesis protein CbiM [Planctomycetes bacterium]|nr:cobalamin biosynthesis protein CbiM [Planctomycetota bacterium]